MKTLAALALFAVTGHAQQPPDHPSITFEGHTYTPRSIVERNMRTEADQTGQFPPHKIIGNIYYVGTKTLSSFLIVTPREIFCSTAPMNETCAPSRNPSRNSASSFPA